MTPDQIHPGRTYETSNGQSWTVYEIFSKVASHSEGNGSMISTLDEFAAYAVRDITPAPESDQVEKVAQAQSHGPSRGDGRGLVRKFAIDVAEYLYNAGHRDDGPSSSDGTRLLRQAREIAQDPPYAAAVNAELMGSLKDIVETVERVDAGVYRDCVDSARAAIARAETANDPPRFRHKRTGDIYELLLIANEHAERTAQYPPTAVYRRLSDQTVWSRPVQDWGKDFEEVVGE